MIYKETYRDLCHGTDKQSAEAIRAEGFQIRGGSESWCGKGIYFYDIKNKAWWAANRKCVQLRKLTGVKVKPTVVYADVVDIGEDKIFDMRVHKNMLDFEEGVKDLFGKYRLEISGIVDDAERKIKLRSILVSYYADRNDKKLVIGCFKQRPQSEYGHIMDFAESLDIIFGIETIYCVKDSGIISNIR